MTAKVTKTRSKKSAASKAVTTAKPSDTLAAIAASTDRAASALESIAGLLGCVIEVIESDKPGGEARCVFRTYEREFSPTYG